MSNVGRMNAAGKVARDAEIVKDRARGYGWEAIAERHEICERQCRQIWSDHWASQPPLGEIDPMETVREALAQQDALVEDLARLADSAKHPALRLGVLKAKREAMRERLIFMQAVGLLPRDLGLLRHEIELRRIIQQVMSAFERHDLPQQVEDDLLDALTLGSIRRGAELALGRNGD